MTERLTARPDRRGRRGRPRKHGLASATYVRLPEDLDLWVRRLAKEADRGLSDQISHLIRESKKRHEQQAAGAA